MDASNNWNPNIDNAPNYKSLGSNIPPDLNNILGTAILFNNSSLQPWDAPMDEELVVKHAVQPLNKELTDAGYVGQRVYITHTDDKTGYVQQDYGTLTGFAKYRAESKYDGGDLISAQGWEIGIQISAKKPEDPNANNDGYVHKTISVSDPNFDLELHDDRQQRIFKETTEELLRYGLRGAPLAHYNHLLAHLKESVSRRQKARVIGRRAMRLLNSRAYIGNTSAEQAVADAIMGSYGPGRFRLIQSSVIEFTADDADDNGLPVLTQTEVHTRPREIVDGQLRSVVILPRFASRQKIAIPYFVIEPAGNSDRTLLAPLERNNSITWLSD